MAIRPSSSVLRNWRRPCPSSPRRFSAGTRTVVEGEAVGVGGVPSELVVARVDGEAGRAGGHEDGADLRRAVVVGARAGGDRDDRREVAAGVGDERLGAVDDPVVAVAGGAGAGGTGVGAAAGLGQPERRERTAGDEVGQEARLLLLAPEAEDRVDAEADPGAERDADGLVDAAELLDRDDERHEVAVGAAVLLRNDETEEAEVAHLRDEVGREVAVAVPLRDVRRDLRLGELAHDRAEVLVLLAQVEHRCGPFSSQIPPAGVCLTFT